MTTWLPAGTPKAMFLVWGDGLGPALTAPALREALAATGALRWSQDLVDLFDLTTYNAFASSPLAFGDTVILPLGGSGEGVVAFERDTGAVV